MKLHLNKQDGNQITAYSSDAVYINGTAYRGSLLVTADKLITDWQANGINDALPAALQQAAEYCSAGMVVLLGAGDKSPAINPQWQLPFAQKQAVLEIMSLPAACRTYNFLNGDQRLVMAMLVLPAV